MTAERGASPQERKPRKQKHRAPTAPQFAIVPPNAALPKEDDGIERLPLAEIDKLGWHDSGNAQRLADRHGANLRYCVETRSMWSYNKAHGLWEGDKLAVERMALDTLQHHAGRAQYIADDEEKSGEKYRKHIARSHNEHPLEAMQRMAFKLVQPVSINEMDLDPLAFNCKNGTVDLLTLELRPHRRADLCSRIVGIDFDLHASAKRWHQFLREVLPNQDVRLSLQIWAGCSATACPEKAFAFAFGTGDNGKSLFLRMLAAVLDRYKGSLLTSTLMQADESTASLADKAGMRGCRCIIASEPTRNKRYNSGELKKMTGGGDPIKAKFLYGQLFEFLATFKLIIDSNYPFLVEDGADAAWNRPKIYPFNEHFPEGKQDTGLTNKLRQELPGILLWVLEGAKMYAESGLYFPAVCDLAKADMQANSDHFPVYLKEVTGGTPTRIAGARTPVKRFRRLYEQWCHDADELPLSLADFKARMEHEGFFKKKLAPEKGSAPEPGEGRQPWQWEGLRIVSQPTGISPAWSLN